MLNPLLPRPAAVGGPVQQLAPTPLLLQRVRVALALGAALEFDGGGHPEPARCTREPAEEAGRQRPGEPSPHQARRVEEAKLMEGGQSLPDVTMYNAAYTCPLSPSIDSVVSLVHLIRSLYRCLTLQTGLHHAFKGGRHRRASPAPSYPPSCSLRPTAL